MPWSIRKGDRVLDLISNQTAVIVGASTIQHEDDGRWFRVYTLDNSIPDNPNYPNRKRLESEIRKELNHVE